MPSERAPRLSRFNLMQFVNGNENGPHKGWYGMAPPPEWCLLASLSHVERLSLFPFPMLVN